MIETRLIWCVRVPYMCFWPLVFEREANVMRTSGCSGD